MTRRGGKMTAIASPSFDRKKYARLLTRTLPAVIKTEEENERMLSEIGKLVSKGEKNLSTEELALIELMSTLVERFEEEHYPIDTAAPADVLRSLMHERGLRQKDIVHIFGSSGIASEVINGKRGISKAQAKGLAEFFHVSPEVFI
jgi:HTH-type transcriptional regulator/antitoxin HigA